MPKADRSNFANALAGRVTAEDMRAISEAVDGRHRDPAEVVREFRARTAL